MENNNNPEKQGKSLPEEKKGTRGPKPNILKIDGDWQEAVKKSLNKKRPPKGWPKN